MYFSPLQLYVCWRQLFRCPTRPPGYRHHNTCHWVLGATKVSEMISNNKGTSNIYMHYPPHHYLWQHCWKWLTNNCVGGVVMQHFCLVYNKNSLPCFYLTSSFPHTVSVELDALTVRKFSWSLQVRRRHHLNSCSCQHWTNTAVFECPGKSRH